VFPSRMTEVSKWIPSPDFARGIGLSSPHSSRRKRTRRTRRPVASRTRAARRRPQNASEPKQDLFSLRGSVSYSTQVVADVHFLHPRTCSFTRAKERRPRSRPEPQRGTSPAPSTASILRHAVLLARPCSYPIPPPRGGPGENLPDPRTAPPARHPLRQKRTRPTRPPFPPKTHVCATLPTCFRPLATKRLDPSRSCNHTEATLPTRF